jgi:ABC-type sugar transport system substrate-binding protein
MSIEGEQMPHFKNRAVAVAALMAASVAVAACGSSSSSTSSGAAEKSVAKNVPSPPTAPPTEIGVSKSLPKRPPSGKTVAFLQCSLPACQAFVPGFKAATEALGWELKTFPYQSPNVGPALQAAVNAGVDYVANTGVPPALFKQQLAAAKAKNIPFISANDVTPPQPSIGYVTNFGDATMFATESVQMGQWIVKNSGGDAHVAYVLIPDYPILQAGVKPLEQTVKRYCSGCSVDTLPVTVNDVASGAVPRKLVAYLQSHPKVNYVDFSFADLLPGVAPALKSAGLVKRVKLVGQALGAAPQVVEAIKNRTVSAWVAQPNVYQSWLMVDAMARLSVGQPLSEERKAAKEPTWVVDAPASAQPLAGIGGWDGPAGFEDKFKQLWNVG